MRAVDPLTRGALRARLNIVGTTVHLRSFLEPATPAGHTIKGSGMVAYRANHKNSKSMPLTWQLRRRLDRHLQTQLVDPTDYNYGNATILGESAIVSINGRRYVISLRYIYNILQNNVYFTDNVLCLKIILTI